MVLQFNDFSKVLESNGTISLIIAIVVVACLVLILFLYLNKRTCPSKFEYGEETHSLSQANRSWGKNTFALNNRINWELLPASQPSNANIEEQVRMNIHSHVKNERELEHTIDRSRFLIRNRGSCSSSSESTATGNCEDDSNAIRQREIVRFARTFSLQEEQMPLAATKEDLDDQFSDIHSAFSDSMSGIIGKCGLLEVAFAYDAPVKKMTIHVLQARDIPATDRGRPQYTQVHIVLLPGKKQKQKSKVRHGDNPQFMESFLFHRITPEDVNNMSVRFRLYGCERMRRQRLIGECIISFSNVNLQLQSNIWVPLEPRANTAINAMACEVLSLCQSNSTGSMQSMQHGSVPELLIGLSYNGTTGRLSVEIVKGSNFRHVTAAKAPDTYVKVMLLSSTGQELARSKTSVRKSQPNPLFKEMFMYQVALFQLCDVSLMVTVYNKKNIKRKERVGWFIMGRNSSGDEESAHWEEMTQFKGELLSRWHILVES